MHALVALLPVLLFLATLMVLDSFKLVHVTAVLTTLAAGALAAFSCYVLQIELADLGLESAMLTRYVGPLTEETAKAVFVIYLVRLGRVGFLVDAAIQGFAVGTGFAVVENVLYLREMGDAPLSLWLVRGLGTAILHGATTAIFAIVSKTLRDRRHARGWLIFVPGRLTTFGVHSAFNHLPLPAVLMTGLLMIVMPLLVLVVFERSERATRDWVGAGLDLDFEMLQLIQSEHFGSTRFSSYLQALRERFPGPVVADMFCLLRVELEVAIQAKAMLLARQAGVEVPVDDDLRASLEEIAYLNRTIGPTGRLALEPLQVTTHRDEWHRHLLRQARAQRKRSCSWFSFVGRGL
jgi:protease PrsW